MSAGKGAPRRAVVIHGAEDTTRPDEVDTIDQARHVGQSLARLGFDVKERVLSLDLSALAGIADNPPDLVFNLVEALAGDGRLIHLPAAVMEHLGLAFTGSPSAALAVSTDKLLTKRLLTAARLPTPETFEAGRAEHAAGRYIVKSLSEDASFGIDAGSVVPAGEVAAEIERRRAAYGGAWFAEAYIDGREFNISLLADGQGVPRTARRRDRVSWP